MLIDSTYFVNKLNLPQVGNAEGLADVNNFIAQYEEQYLRCVLGNELYAVFIDEVSGSGVTDESRWIDLLRGADFTYKGRAQRWTGFIPLSQGAEYSVDGSEWQFFSAGGAGEFDPVAGASSMTLPAGFVGSPLIIEIRGTGKLKPSEYSIVGNTLTLLNGVLFNADTIVYIAKSAALNIRSTSTIKVSPIANYVFYHYVENKTTDFTLTGEVQSSTDNNRTVSPVERLVDTWNRMVDMNLSLRNFLQANKAIYPEYKPIVIHTDGHYSDPFDLDRCGCYDRSPCIELFKKKNSLGL